LQEAVAAEGRNRATGESLWRRQEALWLAWATSEAATRSRKATVATLLHAATRSGVSHTLSRPVGVDVGGVRDVAGV
jgi:hypothetical protein